MHFLQKIDGLQTSWRVRMGKIVVAEQVRKRQKQIENTSFLADSCRLRGRMGHCCRTFVKAGRSYACFLHKGYQSLHTCKFYATIDYI